MIDNRVNTQIVPADKTAIMTGITDIASKLPPSVDLSPEDRQSYPKLGAKSERFVRAASSMVKADKDFLPRSFDDVAFLTDVSVYNDLYDVWQQLDRLTQRVSDLLLVAGSEAYTGALVVYKAAKEFGRGEELDNFVDEMAERFARKNTPDPVPPTQN